MEYYGTFGPACCDIDTLTALFREGMTGIRLNLSHKGLKACENWLTTFREAEKRSNISAKLLIDLQGPELRIGGLEPITLTETQIVNLGNGGIPIPDLICEKLQAGMEILLDDGAILLKVLYGTKCRVERGGILKSRKSIAIPQLSLYLPTLTEDDKLNIALANEYGVTDVMLPFVREAADLFCLRKELNKSAGKHIRIFAKIENLEGVNSLEKLLPYSDEIVIARGDLGNSMPLWELPHIQKLIASKCRKINKPFMIVTQLLHSMQNSAVPTRAEVLDIYNAVLDGASSLMLTGETAIGKYPIEAMRYLVHTAKEALMTSQFQ